MMAAIKQVEHVGDYRLRLTFQDGVAGVVDLRDWVVGRGGVFQPLEDLAYFRRVAIHPEFETIYWPDGVDFCPDVLYALVTGKQIPEEGAGGSMPVVAGGSRGRA